MLIKYKNRIINLDQVTEFMICKDNNIKFFFNFMTGYGEEKEQEYVNFIFESEKERDNAFRLILSSYFEEARICRLD